jgi:ribonuclease HII
MTASQRDFLRGDIEQNAVAWAVAKLSPKEIDRYNILRSSFLAMHRALRRLPVTPAHIVVDGNRFIPFKGIDHTCIVKGDAKYANIAAASILAKTYRDDYMSHMHLKYPAYNWLSNKGYPTKEHRQAIAAHGATKLHRRSFTLLRGVDPETLFDR